MEKVYTYSCGYLRDFLFPYIDDDYQFDSYDDSEQLTVEIKSDDDKSDKTMYVTVFDSKREIVAEYCDDGKTMKFMKGVGKFSTAAYISSCLKNGQEFSISDKKEKTIGITRIHILGENYIITGGKNSLTKFIYIDELNVKEITKKVMKCLIESYLSSLDAKSAKITLTKDIATRIGTAALSKPYIVISDI